MQFWEKKNGTIFQIKIRLENYNFIYSSFSNPKFLKKKQKLEFKIGMRKLFQNQKF